MTEEKTLLVGATRQTKAIRIERIFKKIYDGHSIVEAGDFLAIFNLDASGIEDNPDSTIRSALSYLYIRSSTEKRKEIKSYLNKYYKELKYPIEELLKQPNGEEAVDAYTDALFELVTTK